MTNNIKNNKPSQKNKVIETAFRTVWPCVESYTPDGSKLQEFKVAEV